MFADSKFRIPHCFIIFWIFSQNFDQIITMWHSGYIGDTPLGKKYPFVKKLSPKNTFCDFQVCTIAASV